MLAQYVDRYRVFRNRHQKINSLITLGREIYFMNILITIVHLYYSVKDLAPNFLMHLIYNSID
jgi:hypothetical protein